MPSIPHVHRRGAVYYWRRRVPKQLSGRLGSHFVLSLQTTNQRHARLLAAQLDDKALRMFRFSETENGADHRLGPDQVKAMFREVALKHLDKLDRVAVFDRLQPAFDLEESRQTDLAMGYAYRLLASRGPEADVDEAVVRTLEAEGLSRAVIERIASNLSELRRNNMNRDSRNRLEALLSTVGATPSPINFGIAQTTKHRAMAAALLDTRRRWDAIDPDDAILLGAITRTDAETLPASRPVVVSPGVSMTRSAGPVPQAVATPEPTPPEAPNEPAAAKTLDGSVVAVAEELLTGSMKNVDEKTKRQVRSTAEFFARYLAECHGVVDLRELRQPHLAGFVKLLQSEVYIHHGKSEQDAHRSFTQLRAIWRTKAPDQIGIDKPTTERWCGHLKQLLRTGRVLGLSMDRDLSFEGLIVNKGRSKRARNARPTMSVTQTGSIYQQPPFLGCQGWDALAQGGELVFHCAVYFATMLCTYGGARREEICGLLVADIILDNGDIPYAWIADNKFRRIKNPQSERPMTIHPELIRLGFLLYVAAIKALEYELLFPDLYSPTSRSPLGDRLHDQLRPILDAAGITAKGTGLHSSRRGFGNNLKQKNVNAEKRAELLGHGGDSETTERYCDAFHIKILQRQILKLPNVTRHLEAKPINLLPWVEAKQQPPFSHPGRSKQAKERNRAAKSNSLDPGLRDSGRGANNHG